MRSAVPGHPPRRAASPHWLGHDTQMKTHLLRYFVVLAEELHFGRAALRLAITQPPLSVAIKSLEEDLGVRLLERDAKQVRLTDAGAAFLIEARQVLSQIQRAADVARNVAQGRQGQLDIGVTGSMIYRDLPHVMQAFAQQRPDIDITLHEMSTTEQQAAILRGQLQGGFVNIITPAPGLELWPLAPDTLVCCLPENHPQAQQASLPAKGWNGLRHRLREACKVFEAGGLWRAGEHHMYLRQHNQHPDPGKHAVDHCRGGNTEPAAQAQTSGHQL